MKYRKPITNIRDRHVLIELDGDFTYDEMRHILNHAYLNHKAPHEYDEVKKYIRDLVIGEHNSVYIMNNGVPEPLASASIFYSPAVSVVAYNASFYYDYVSDAMTGGGGAFLPSFVNNETCTSSTHGNLLVTGPLLTYGYNNGTALLWELLYTNNSFTSLPTIAPGTYSNGLVVGPRGTNSVPHAGIKYGYTLYQTSSNPLTLAAYYYWEGVSESFSYVYFNIVGTSCNSWGSYSCDPSQSNLFVPLFYSQGNYSFNANTYYISMWQFTYT
ncbi:MAG: hypothetical protein RXQ99_10605 [Acidianus sp.]|uniref:hypothetical protein n=1 Tax=Acidianus sp. TaxID=1872104 RepID=UPI00397E1EBB